GDTGGEKIHFIIAGKLHIAEGALAEQRQTRWPATAEELREMVVAIAKQRDGIEWRIHIGSLGMLPPYGFGRQEATRSDSDSFIANGGWALIDCLLCFLHSESVVGGIEFDVTDIALQLRNRGGWIGAGLK